MTTSEIKNDELKPCPFCGNKKVKQTCECEHCREHADVHCVKCGTYAPIAIWNTRTPEPTKAEKCIECSCDWHTLTYQEYCNKHGAYPRSCPMCHSCFNPKPKAENGLVPLSEKELRQFIHANAMGHEYFGFKSAEEVDELAKRICAHFATPSITKEQLLAILPEKLPEPTYFPAVEGRNQAIDEMKQRIEELFK